MHPVARISCEHVKMFFSASYCETETKSGGKYKSSEGK
jgi:hypothetical protein